MAKSPRPAKTAKDKNTVRNSRTTVSGPAAPDTSGPGDILAEKAAGTQDVASAFPFNPNKAAEYDPDAALAPPEGASVKSADPIVGASTVTERNGSDKVGSGGPNIGQNPTVGPLDRVRVDSTDRVLTTNQGVPVGDNQHSLKAGLRGPTLLEDFILREKITHFDHERIPERIVHARGSAAHGVFECTKAISEFTRASLLGEVANRHPSSCASRRSSANVARRTPRGMSVASP
jgi:catalase